MSTGALKSDKSLKNALRFNLRECNFSKLPGGNAPRPPSIGMLCMPVCFAHYESAYPGYPHINNADTSGCAPPFQKSGSAPAIYAQFKSLQLVNQMKQLNNNRFRLVLYRMTNGIFTVLPKHHLNVRPRITSHVSLIILHGMELKNKGVAIYSQKRLIKSARHI